MKKRFFSIKLTDEQRKLMGDQDIQELVAVDYVRVRKPQKINIELTKSQKKIVEENTNMNVDDIEINWKPAMHGLSESDVRPLEEKTLRGCDFWSVPTSDTV
jgi:hypothetical protein